MENSELNAQKPNLTSIEFDGELIDTDRLEYYAKLNYKSFLEMADKIKDINNKFYNETVIPVIKKYEKRYEKRMEERNKETKVANYNRFGWGWYILSGLCYKNSGTSFNNVFYFIIALIPTLMLYFYMRKKFIYSDFLQNIKYKVFLASLISGLISMFVFQIIFILLLVLISLLK